MFAMEKSNVQDGKSIVIQARAEDSCSLTRLTSEVSLSGAVSGPKSPYQTKDY